MISIFFIIHVIFYEKLFIYNLKYKNNVFSQNLLQKESVCIIICLKRFDTSIERWNKCEKKHPAS